MWRAGAWVVADSGAGQQNPMRAHVSDTAGFVIGDDVQILSGDSFETANGEFGTVYAIGPGYVDVDTDPGPDLAGLKQLYRSAGGPPPADQAPFSFLARVLPGVYDANQNTASMAVAFDDAYAEWVVLPMTGFVPHWPLVPDPEIDLGYLALRSPPFFRSLSDPNRPPILNTVQLVSAADADGAFGLSVSQFDWTWVFHDRIVSFYPLNVAAASESTTAHELAHQFDVNQMDTKGYDAEEAWT